MKKRTAVLFLVAGMMLNACNPIETSKPLETTAAVINETTTAETSAAADVTAGTNKNTDKDVIVFETDAVEADPNTSKAIVGKKKGDTNPLRPTLESGKLKPKADGLTPKESDGNDTYSSDPVITDNGYQSYLDVMAVPITDAPAGLNHYQSSTFWFDNLEWELEIWTSASPGADGWYSWDDQNRFYIRTYNNSGDQFVLMDDMVAIGYPTADVYDDGKWLHIIISDFRTATAKITDYSFLSEDNFFGKTVILEQYGINYMTGIDVR